MEALFAKLREYLQMEEDIPFAELPHILKMLWLNGRLIISNMIKKP